MVLRCNQRQDNNGTCARYQQHQKMLLLDLQVQSGESALPAGHHPIWPPYSARQRLGKDLTTPALCMITMKSSASRLHPQVLCWWDAFEQTPGPDISHSMPIQNGS